MSICHAKGVSSPSQSSKGADGSLSFAVSLPISSTRFWGYKYDKLFHTVEQPETICRHVWGGKPSFLPNPELLHPAQKSFGKSFGKGQGTGLNTGL